MTGAILLAGFLINVALATSASAHVKWFCGFDVAGQPDGLHKVLCPDFGLLVGLSITALLAGALVEATTIGAGLLYVFDRLTRCVRDNIESIFRASCAFFFIAIWAVGGILLTPELKTRWTTIGAIQLSIAGGMLSQRTMPFSALGIVILYAIAIRKYGFFHLADYPVFLGVAAYLALIGIQSTFFGVRPIDVLRWTTSVTLMWSSIEKWAYPEWSYPLLYLHPELTFGFSPEYYMRAAGAVEFALAFALLWTPLVRRVAAALLIGILVSAVFEFGKIDLIGHSLFVVTLLGILADDGGKLATLRSASLLPVRYAAALIGLLALYYGWHAAAFGTTIL